MSHYILYNLSIKSIENFSLLKQGKRKIFGIYKNTKYKALNLYNNIFFIPRNDIMIVKEINIKFIATIKKNYFNDIDNSFLIKNSGDNINSLKLIYHHDYKTQSLDYTRYLKNNNKLQYKYCKKVNNKTISNKNGLIKPVLLEDNFKSANIEDYPKSNSFINKYASCNKYLIDNFIKKYNFNYLLTKENYFKNKNLYFEKKLEPIISKPIIVENINQNPKNNKIGGLNQIKLNNCNFLDKSKEEEKLFNEKTNINLKYSSTQGSSSNNIINKPLLKTVNKSKGRKAKNSNILNVESTHTKHSPDNMMRKIKNKVIESSRQLVNKVLSDEIKNNKNIRFNIIHKEFRKIKGSFGQELNIKYNFWFYQITIKDIFTLEISNKYSATEKNSNKEIIDYLYSPLNNNNFIKTKKLLNIPFHQFYHDIFLNEEPNWKIYYGIDEKDNKYQIDYLLNNLEEEEKGQSNNENSEYIYDINLLAHKYEEFFLEKKPRNIDYNNKKNEFIKDFMNNTLNDKYLKLSEEVKNYKIFYENRNLLKNSLKENVLPDKKSDEIVKNTFIKSNNLININKEIINNENNKNNNIINFNNKNIQNNNIDLEKRNDITLKEEEEEQEEEKKEKENYDENIVKNKNIKKEIIIPKMNEISKSECLEKHFCKKKRKNSRV